MTPEVLVAFGIAVEAHSEQKRKALKEPFIVHPMRIALTAARFARSCDLDTDEAVQIALLHDVIEDTEVTAEDLVLRGISKSVVHEVELLTQWWPDDAEPEVKAEYKPTYYKAIMDSNMATFIKILDRADNLYDMTRMIQLKPSGVKWARRYLARTQEEIHPLKHVLAPNNPAWQYFEQIESNLKKALGD